MKSSVFQEKGMMEIMIYDVVIIGGGPSGSTLARLLEKKYKVLLLDKRNLQAPKDYTRRKCCGGLLAPDAQKVLAQMGLGLPKEVLMAPQVFSVKALDYDYRKHRCYQRHYINVDREGFDRWLLSLVSPAVEIREECVFKGYRRLEGGSREKRLEGRLSEEKLSEGRLPEEGLSEGKLLGERLPEEGLSEEKLPKEKLWEGNLSGGKLPGERLPEEGLSKGKLWEGKLPGERLPEREDSMIEVQWYDLKTKQTQKALTHLLVGADGATSQVRRSMEREKLSMEEGLWVKGTFSSKENLLPEKIVLQNVM